MSAVTQWLLALAVGAGTGVLSGFGVGGGTLLLVYLSAFAGVDQRLAQGINLLYFLPAAVLALISHGKNGFLERSALLPAIGAGLLFAGLGAWTATALDTALLRRLFGGFLLLTGIGQLLGRSGEEKQGGNHP